MAVSSAASLSFTEPPPVAAGGGQLFSKSFLGYTTYKMEFATREGLLPAIVLMILPFVILGVLIRLLPPWGHGEGDGGTRAQG